MIRYVTRGLGFGKRSFETIYAKENEHEIWSWECAMS
jgi:hypothetical protein